MGLDIKNNSWGYFRYYYHIIGVNLIVTVFLSIVVGALDGIGLTMLIPLLQSIDGGTATPKHSLGQLNHIITFFKSIGFALTLNTVLAIFIVMFVMKGVIKFLEQTYQVKVQKLFMKKVQHNLVRKLQEISYRGYLQLDAGKIQNTFIAEVHRMAQAMKNYMKWTQAVFMLATYIALAFLANFEFAFLVTASACLTNIIYRRIQRKIKAASLEISKKGHNLNGYMIEIIHHFKYLKSTNYLTVFSKKIKRVINETEALNKKTGTYSALTTSIREPIIVIIVVAVIFIQVNWIGGSLGSVILSLLLFYRGLNFLMSIQNEWQSFILNCGAMQTVNEVLETMMDMKEVQGTVMFQSLQGKISLENISFSYGNTPVLNGVTINLYKNSTIALTGVSGSGKTTLVNIIAALLSPDSGAVLIDGININNYNLNSYRSKIGYISQESVVFNDTLFNNITFWDDKTPQTLQRFWEVIKMTSLEEFVKTQPEYENTLLGSNGILISGGQRQRISIARELYKNPEILILDEATSALDSETESVIQENIEKLHGRYTMVIIAHRLSTIKNADKIYLLDKGKVINSGDFNTLLLKSDKFKNMVSLQKVFE